MIKEYWESRYIHVSVDLLSVWEMLRHGRSGLLTASIFSLVSWSGSAFVILQVRQDPARGKQDGHEHRTHGECLLSRGDNVFCRFGGNACFWNNLLSQGGIEKPKGAREPRHIVIVACFGLEKWKLVFNKFFFKASLPVVEAGRKVFECPSTANRLQVFVILPNVI